MAKQSGYLRRQTAALEELQDVSMRHGQQWALDCLMIALHRQGWGYDRIKRLLDETEKIAAYYNPTMHPCMEQDVFIERMDAELRDIVKGRQEFYDFKSRYPGVKIAGYDKAPKKVR